jgi:hypothetical protein
MRIFHYVVQFLATDNIALYGMTIGGNRNAHDFAWADTDSKFQNGGANTVSIGPACESFAQH